MLKAFRIISFASALMMPVVGFASPASASSGVQCATSTVYGSMCGQIIGSGLVINDFHLSFTAPNSDYLTGRSWRWRVTTYACNPIGKTKIQCPPSNNPGQTTSTKDGRIRSGNPPIANTSYCQTMGYTAGPASLSVTQCETHGEAHAYATLGDIWPSTHVDPSGYTYTRSSGWLCGELAIKVGTTYVDNGSGAGLRACFQLR